MYKFKCCKGNEISTGYLLFSQLESTANNVINETLELQQEFKTKLEFANEQFMKVYKNEQEITNIFQILMTMQQHVSNLEEELKAVEFLLQQLSNIKQHLEISGTLETFCIRNICGHFCHCKTERQGFLELLEETNRKMQELPGLMENMLEFRNYGKLVNPYTEIFAILNHHCQILKNTEKNIDLLSDKLTSIELAKTQMQLTDKSTSKYNEMLL